MTIQEFADCFQRLMCAYGRKFCVDFSAPESQIQKTGETWYQFFSEYDSADFSKVVNDWIITEKTAPSISDLRKKVSNIVCRRINKRKRQEEPEDDGRLPMEEYMKLNPNI